MAFGHESSESRRARVALQLRDKHGKWIEMGGGIKWFHNGAWHHGTVDDFKGTNVGVKMDDGSQQFISHTLVEPIHAKASLPPVKPAGSTVHTSGAVNGNGNNVIKIKDNVAGQRLTTGVKELQVGDRVYAINHSNGTSYSNNSSNPFSVNNGIASQLENAGFEIQTNPQDHSPIYGTVKSVTHGKFVVIDTGNNKTVALGWNHQVIADDQEVEAALHEAQTNLNSNNATAKAMLPTPAVQAPAPVTVAKYSDDNQMDAYHELRGLGFSEDDASAIVESKDPKEIDNLFTGSTLGKSLQGDYDTRQYVDFPSASQKTKWGSYARAVRYLDKIKADLSATPDDSTNATVPGTLHVPDITPEILAKNYDDLTPGEKMAWDKHFQYLGGKPAATAAPKTAATLNDVDGAVMGLEHDITRSKAISPQQLAQQVPSAAIRNSDGSYVKLGLDDKGGLQYQVHDKNDNLLGTVPYAYDPKRNDNILSVLNGDNSNAATSTSTSTPSILDHADALPDGTILRDGSKVSNAPGSTMFKNNGKWFTPGQPPTEIDPKTFAQDAYIDTMPLLDSSKFTPLNGATLRKGDVATTANGKQFIISYTGAGTADPIDGVYTARETGVINGRRGANTGQLKESDITGVHQWGNDNTTAPAVADDSHDDTNAPSPATPAVDDSTDDSTTPSPVATTPAAVDPDDASNVVDGDHGSYSFTSKNDANPNTAVTDMVKAYNTQDYAPMYEAEYHAGNGYKVGFVDKQDTDSPVFAVYDQSGNVVAKHIIDMAYGPATSVEKSIAKDIADDMAAKSGISAPAAPSAPASTPANKSFTPVSGFSVGDRVTHGKHGVGTVQKLESNGQYARVNFDKYGDPKKNHGISLTKLSHHTAPATPAQAPVAQAPAAPAVVPNVPATRTPTVTSRVLPPAGGPVSVPAKGASQAEKTAFANLMNDEVDNHILPENASEVKTIQSNIKHYEGEAADAENDGDYAKANKFEGLADQEWDKLSALVVKNYNTRTSNGKNATPAQTVAPVATTPVQAPAQPVAAPTPAVSTPNAPSTPTSSNAPAPTKAANTPIDISKWTAQSGTQMGSNPGGIYTDPSGKKWYVKHSKSDEHAQTEVLADQLYADAGIPSAGLKLADVGGGKLGTASPMLDGAKADLSSHLKDKAYIDKVQEGFAVDAWLANWDVTGTAYDNIVTDKNGNPVRIDPGGALHHRAQGAAKGTAFGDKANEWDSLRNQPGSATKAFFGSITDQQLIDSAAKVAAFDDKKIDDRVDSLGFKKATADMLKERLKARRDDIEKRAAALQAKTPTAQQPSKFITDPTAGPAPTPATPPVTQIIPDPTATPAATPTKPTMLGMDNPKTAIEDLKRALADGNISDGAHYPAGNGYTVAWKNAAGSIKTFEVFDPQGKAVATHFYADTALDTVKNALDTRIKTEMAKATPAVSVTSNGPTKPTNSAIATADSAIEDLKRAEQDGNTADGTHYPAGRGYTVAFKDMTSKIPTYELYDSHGNPVATHYYDVSTPLFESQTKNYLKAKIDADIKQKAAATPAPTVSTPSTNAPTPIVPTPASIATHHTAIDDLMAAEKAGDFSSTTHYPAGNGYTVAFAPTQPSNGDHTFQVYDPNGNKVGLEAYLDTSTSMYTNQTKAFLDRAITSHMANTAKASTPATASTPTPSSAIDDLLAAEASGNTSSAVHYEAGNGYNVAFTPAQNGHAMTFQVFDPKGLAVGQPRTLDKSSSSLTKTLLANHINSHMISVGQAPVATPVSSTTAVGPWKVGDRVMHPKHGLGTVKKLESNGQYARVNFDQYNDPNKHHGIALSKLSMAPAPTPAGVTSNPVTPTPATKAGIQVNAQGKPFIPGKNGDELHIGANVHHARFGDGVVVSLEKNGTHARIRFNNDPSTIKGVKGTMLSNSTTLHTTSTSPTNIPTQNNTGDPVHQGQDLFADQNLVATLSGTHRRSPTKGDGQLFKAYQAQGFDKALPHKVDDAEFAKRTSEGWTTLYRGLAGYGTSVNVKTMVDNFYEGDHYAGFGIYGNGSYSTPDKSVAAGYSGGRSGHIMEMQMNPKAKTIDYHALKAMMRADLGSGYRGSNPTLWKAFKDPGVYAAAKGYDVISVPTRENGQRMPYYVILNRSILSYKSKDNAY